MGTEDFEKLKQDCEMSPNQFHLGYIQAMHETGNISQEQYQELADLMENSNDYRDI